MVVRKFKPGDRVEYKKGGPVMEVVKYITENSPIYGKHLSKIWLECVWFENGERKKKVFHQNNLMKSSKKVGLFIT